jgi:hypothetical protein
MISTGEICNDCIVKPLCSKICLRLREEVISKMKEKYAGIISCKSHELVSDKIEKIGIPVYFCFYCGKIYGIGRSQKEREENE